MFHYKDKKINFDDVLIYPKPSRYNSRKEINLDTIKVHPIPKTIKTSEKYIDYLYALKRLDDCLPKNRILVTDFLF